MEDEKRGGPHGRAIAFPAGTDVVALARAWFPEAEQVAGSTAGPARRLVGARFSGSGGVPQQGPGGPGLVRVTADAALRGPQSPVAAGVALPAGLEDVYLVEASAVTPWSRRGWSPPHVVRAEPSSTPGGSRSHRPWTSSSA